MTVLDAYALIAYLRDEAAAADVEVLLREPAVLSAVNATEVVDQLVRVFGRDADDVEADMAILAAAGMRIVPVTPETAILAGRMRARHYNRTQRAVSLADCVAAALGSLSSQSVATADPALAAVIRETGGKVVALPDSRGNRP